MNTPNVSQQTFKEQAQTRMLKKYFDDIEEELQKMGGDD